MRLKYLEDECSVVLTCISLCLEGSKQLSSVAEEGYDSPVTEMLTSLQYTTNHGLGNGSGTDKKRSELCSKMRQAELSTNTFYENRAAGQKINLKCIQVFWVLYFHL